MIVGFFNQRFHREKKQLHHLLEFLKEHEEQLPSHVYKLANHIVHVHHKILAQLEHRPSESNAWDFIGIDLLGRLHEDNHRVTQTFLLHLEDISDQIPAGELEDIFLQLDYILQHTAYHRGQIHLLAKESGVSFAPLHFTLHQDD
jgi:uncharacterized damage-inducible protein DinB